MLVSGGLVPLTISYSFLSHSYSRQSPSSLFMASSLEPIGVLTGLLFSALSRFNVVSFYRAGFSPFTLKGALGPDFRYRRARVGRILAAQSYFFVVSPLLDLEAVRKTHLNINRWSDEEVIAWKGSYVSGCAATAVAVRTLRYDHPAFLNLAGSYFCKRGIECSFLTEHRCHALERTSFAVC